MVAEERIIRWSTAGSVGVAAVAAVVVVVVSYEHAYDLVSAHVEAGWASRRRLRPTWRTALGHGLIGAAVAAWPAVPLVGSYELLILIIHGAPCHACRPSLTTVS
jgi:hypothetical protein